MQDTKHTMSEKLDYNKITDHIYIGTSMCCQTHFDQHLLDEGITVDISLEKNHLDAPYGAKAFLWLPTKDLTPPTPEQLELGIAMLKKIENNSAKVYVHCRMGHGRAPTLVAAYLIKEKNMKTEAAINFIKQRRPVIHLEDSQIEALKKLEK